MAISYVGGQASGRAGSTGTSAVSFAFSPQAGDLVVITLVVGSAGRNPTLDLTAQGYTNLTQLNPNTTTQDTSLCVCYKVMGSTPDTGVTMPSTGNNQDAQSWAIQCFRGVDSSSPMDTTPVSATGTATGRPNPGSITPVTAGAWVVICGGGCAATGAAYTAPANFTTNFLTANTVDTNDAMVGSGYWSGWASGAVDPAAYTGGTTNAADSWAAYTLALRPAPPDQTLTQSSIFSNTSSFYAVTVTPGTASLTQSSTFSNTNSFYAATVTPGTASLSQASRFDNTNSFYAATVAVIQQLTQTETSQNATLTWDSLTWDAWHWDQTTLFYPAVVTVIDNTQLTQATRFDTTNAFYGPTVSASITLPQASRFDSTNSFFAATVTPGQVSLPQASRLDNVNTFYGPSVSMQLVQASRFDNSNSFYAPAVAFGLAQTARLDSTNVFYTPTVTPGQVVLSPEGRHNNSNSFFSATITTATSVAQSTRFDNSNTFFAFTVTPSRTITQASRFDNSQAFYSVTVSPGTVSLSPGLFADTDTFYGPMASPGQTTLLAELHTNVSTFYEGTVTGGDAVVANDGSWIIQTRRRSRR